MTQVALSFCATPVSAEQDAETLIFALTVCGCWVRRACLQQKDMFQGWPERRFRAAASASKGRIIGSARGYCLTALASVSDVEHAERALLSQARQMQQRAVEIRRARNAHG
jgi:hypothetical protein